ncbi:19316_t:CDS:2, partial [Cetraspora pellucida]
NPVLPGLSLNLMSLVLPKPLLPLNLVLSELSLDHMSPVLPGPSLNIMSILFLTPVDINSPVDFLLSPVTNFSSDRQSSEQGSLIENNNIDNGIIIDTDLEKSENLIDTSGLNNDLTFVNCIHNPQVTCDSTKWRNAVSQQTECPWRLNVYCSKKSNILKITSFVDNHNHMLSTTIHETAPKFRKLMLEMLSDIEKYVIQGRMDSGSIYPLLKHDYLNNLIFKKDLYNAVYQFRATNNPGNSDASQMLQMLLS